LRRFWPSPLRVRATPCRAARDPAGARRLTGGNDGSGIPTPRAGQIYRPSIRCQTRKNTPFDEVGRYERSRTQDKRLAVSLITENTSYNLIDLSPRCPRSVRGDDRRGSAALVLKGASPS